MGLRSHYEDKYHKGTPGTRWAFFRKFVIERVPGDPYLTRWRLFQTPWGGVLLHKIDGPDPDDHPHDHPWPFISVVLKGGYVEQFTEITPVAAYSPRRIKATKMNKWGWLSVHKMKQGNYHKILKLMNKPTWTLILVGPRRGDWGFLTENGHVPWREYLGV